MEWFVGNYLTFVFYIAFFAAGMQTGQQCRRNDRALLHIMGTLMAGMYVSTLVFALSSGIGLPDLPEAFIPAGINTALIGFGFLLGKSGAFG